MFFDETQLGAPDPVFGWLAACKEDTRPNKLNLIVGTYKDEHFQNPLLSAVRKAERKIEAFADYLPIGGLVEFCEQIGTLCFGKTSWKEQKGRICSTQSVGGTGALRVAAEFLRQEVGFQFAVTVPTWPTQRSIVERVGGSLIQIPYYSSHRHAVDWEQYFSHLRSLSPKTIVFFHACCHNPTGCDPNKEAWKTIAGICEEKRLFPLFDVAYQGFGDGVEEDVAAVRTFFERGIEMGVAYSCSKNFSLYSERTGALFIVTANHIAKAKVDSQLLRIIRNLYSNPPAHGARIVSTILSDLELETQWRQELNAMRHRICANRIKLVALLEQYSKKMDFQFILKRKGMFSYLDLTQEQVDMLIRTFGIYLLENGRMNISGLNQKNMEFFVHSLLEVCEA